MEVIPAIDLLAGQAVRLKQGRYEDVTIYADDPARLASEWAGRAARLHVVDLEGARAGHAVQKELVTSLVRAFRGPVQVGGGIRSLEAAESYLALGVDRIVLGTAALREPALVKSLAVDHPGRIVVAVDARQGRIAVGAWAEQSERLAVDLARELRELPIAALLYTDIDRDGMEVGPNVDETARLAREGGLPVIASGGVGTLAHLTALAPHPGIVGAIVGRAIHEKRFSLEQANAAAASA
jgi:phosphoribosylformimino-5-aminoimidazole carboxamide ribotide isomerase